jgi:hypothetical protein
MFSGTFYEGYGQSPVTDLTENGTGLINLNPDPEGEPWIAGGLRPLTPQDIERMEKIPELRVLKKRSATGATAELPYKVNNTEHPQFRSIFNQKGGSCSQASSIGYVYTYEINFLRGLTSDVAENQYPYGYTYNFLNSGDGSRGAMHWDGWDIGMRNGIPTVEDWGEFGAGDHTRWMSGYGSYYNAMENRVADYYKITIDSPTDLETFKEWLHDHGDGSAIGGVAVFAADADRSSREELPSGTEQGGKDVITAWGDGGGHSMTIAGYNDSIRYDYNGDGKYTIDLDINGDGRVNMQDWEIGGVIMVNTWGTSWGNSGKAYMMYRVLAEEKSRGGIWDNQVWVVVPKAENTPLLTFKVDLTYTDRNSLRIRAGISNNIESTRPALYKEYANAFNYSGGSLPMQGDGKSSTIEIGLDVSEFLDEMIGDEAKFFLEIESKGGGSGQVNSFSMMDHTRNEVVELECPDRSISIDGGTTRLSIIKSIRLLALLSPRGGEEWERGRTFNITWNDFVDGNVKIELLKDGEVLQLISSSTQGNGRYTWTIDDQMPVGDNYQLRITSIDDGTVFDQSGGFSIGPKSILNITSPFSGDILEKGDAVAIAWEDNLSGNISLELYKNGWLSETIAGDIPSSSPYSWRIPENIPSGDDYRIRIVSEDKRWLYDEIIGFITIQNPVIASFPYIQNFDSFKEGTALTAFWEQLETEELDWTILSGPTPSKVHVNGGGTGPDGDHTSGEGNYIYVEASGDNHPAKRMDLLTPVFDLSRITDPELSFWCHMFSVDGNMGELWMDIAVNGSWQEDALHLEGDHGDRWFLQTVDLSRYQGNTVQFRFRGITGTDYDGDICIDDFRIDGAPVNADRKENMGVFRIHRAGSQIFLRNISGRVAIHSLTGKELMKAEADGYTVLDISGLAGGIYVLQTQNRNIKFVR